MKEIYLAGGCYWGVEKYCASIRGVVATEVGFANGHMDKPTYDQVKHTDTGHAETVHVTYDEQVVPLACLLRLFFRTIDPTAVDRQGHDVGHQYRTGVYWTDPQDAVVVRRELERLAQGWACPIHVEAQELQCFWRAEEEHQGYLDKHPGGYCHVPWEDIAWVKQVDPRCL